MPTIPQLVVSSSCGEGKSHLGVVVSSSSTRVFGTPVRLRRVVRCCSLLASKKLSRFLSLFFRTTASLAIPSHPPSIAHLTFPRLRSPLPFVLNNTSRPSLRFPLSQFPVVCGEGNVISASSVICGWLPLPAVLTRNVGSPPPPPRCPLLLLLVGLILNML